MSSAYSYTNSSITQAFLPNKGMRFAGANNVQVHDWAPAGSRASLRQRPVTNLVPGTANTTGSTISANGSISGGLLRPGAIDQTQFKAMLNAASVGVPGTAISKSPLPGAPSSGLLPAGLQALAPNAALAAQGLRPAPASNFNELSANAIGGAGGGIQNLTPAQFAALTGGVNLPGGASLPVAVQAETSPAGPTVNSGAPDQGGNSPAMSDASIPADEPTQTAALSPNDQLAMSDASIPADSPADAQIAAAGTAAAGGDKIARAADGTPFGSKDKNGVLVLNQIPDKDMRQEYAAKGIKWRIADNPESNKLFFGPDGKFGWDDVADLINPLQHIPLVNIAYRHFTGDQETGAAELLGAIPFGPLGTISAIADLAVRSVTGKDIGENVIAMVTGNHEAASENVAQAGSSKSNTDSANANSTNTGGAVVAELTPDQTPSHEHQSK